MTYNSVWKGYRRQLVPNLYECFSIIKERNVNYHRFPIFKWRILHNIGKNDLTFLNLLPPSEVPVPFSVPWTIWICSIYWLVDILCWQMLHCVICSLATVELEELKFSRGFWAVIEAGVSLSDSYLEWSSFLRLLSRYKLDKLFISSSSRSLFSIPSLGSRMGDRVSFDQSEASRSMENPKHNKNV